MVNYVETNKAAFGNGNDEFDLENVENRKFSKLTTEALIIIGRQQVKATGAYILIVGSLNSSRSASFFSSSDTPAISKSSPSSPLHFNCLRIRNEPKFAIDNLFLNLVLLIRRRP